MNPDTLFSPSGCVLHRDRPASRQERFAIELGKGIHDANALLTGTPNGISNALMALGILADRLHEVFGPTWHLEAQERGLLT